MGPMVRAPIAALLLALAPAAEPQESDATASVVGGPSVAGLAPRLAPRLGLALQARTEQRSIGLEPGVLHVGTAAPCPPDWCQPRVDVPGMGAARPSVSRAELAATLLDAANLEPLSSVVWLVARTGLELQWKPPRIGGGLGTGAGGFGDVFVWWKLRLDPWNRPSFPTRTLVSAPRA